MEDWGVAYCCFFMLSYLPSQSALMHTELQACETRKRLTGICDLINLVQTTPMSNGQSTKALRLTYGYRERSPSFGLKESREGESLSSEVGCCPSEAISNCPTADARTINRLVTQRSCLESFAKMSTQDVSLQSPLVSLAAYRLLPQDTTASISAVFQYRGDMKRHLPMRGRRSKSTHCGVAHWTRAAVLDSFDCDRGSD